MKLIRPTPIADAQLVDSTVAESDHFPWSAGTTYGLGERTTQAHRIWESMQAVNLAHDPQTAGVAWWVDMGPTNRWAMFDGKLHTATTADALLTIELAPGRIDALALLQVEASVATVSMAVGAEEVYSRTVSLIDDSAITDWHLYFFEPVRPKDYLVLTDLPVFGEATTTIELSKLSGTVSCGMCVVGQQVDLGGTLSSPSVGINDYSQKSTDDFGNATLVQRSFSKRLSAKLIVDNPEVDRIVTALSAVRAIPVLWIGDEHYSALLIYGFYRDFEVDIAYKRFSYCTLNIEGMI